jgi:hypothetical protein
VSGTASHAAARGPVPRQGVGPGGEGTDAAARGRVWRGGGAGSGAAAPGVGCGGNRQIVKGIFFTNTVEV